MLVQVRIVCAVCGAVETREINDSIQVTPMQCSSCESNEQQGFENDDDPFSSYGHIRPLDFND